MAETNFPCKARTAKKKRGLEKGNQFFPVGRKKHTIQSEMKNWKRKWILKTNPGEGGGF